MHDAHQFIPRKLIVNERELHPAHAEPDRIASMRTNELLARKLDLTLIVTGP